MAYYVYMLTNRKDGTLYIGVSNDIIRRAHEHKTHVVKGFTERYNLDKLVYFEVFEDPISTIQREKNLKRYLREWKIELIEKNNPEWEDLYAEVCA